MTSLPPPIESLLTSNSAPHAVLSALMPALGKFLRSDRCFLYLRNPLTWMGRVPFCWTRTSDIPTIYDEHWKPEPASLADEDPMFSAALQAKPSIFVEDVETASPSILNQQFERENFGHCALIHAHLCQDNQLWGVLQPCLMNESRHWSEFERSTIARIVKKLTPLAVTYVKSQTKIENLP